MVAFWNDRVEKSSFRMGSESFFMKSKDRGEDSICIKAHNQTVTEDIQYVAYRYCEIMNEPSHSNRSVIVSTNFLPQN